MRDTPVLLERLDPIGLPQDLPDLLGLHSLPDRLHRNRLSLGRGRDHIRNHALVLGFLDRGIRAHERARQAIDEAGDGRLVLVDPVGDSPDHDQDHDRPDLHG
jgi:hypothetical protein